MRIQKMLGLVGIAAAAMLTANVSADTMLWNPTSGQNYATAANWFNVDTLSPAIAAPTTGDIAIIQDRSVDPEVTAAATPDQVVIVAGGELTVKHAGFDPGSMAVYGTLNLDVGTSYILPTNVSVNGGTFNIDNGSIVRFLQNTTNLLLIGATINVDGEWHLESDADLLGTATFSLGSTGVLGALSGECRVDDTVVILDTAGATIFSDGTSELVFEASYDGAPNNTVLESDFRLDYLGNSTGQFTIITGKVVYTNGDYCRGGHASKCAGINADTAGFAWFSSNCEAADFCQP